VKIAMMGTRGVPAQYGGFETAVEEIGKRLVQRGHEVTVYCRNPGQTITEYEGMKLVNAPAVRHRMAETLSHTAVSTAHSIIADHPDVVFLLNAGNAPLLPPLKAARIPTAIHLDGLESKREKWRGTGAKYYRWAEKASINWGQEVIADAQAIADYVQRDYGRSCVVIPYGAEVIDPGSDRISELDLTPQGYHLIVARFEPENHVLDAVHAYRESNEQRPLIVVGSAPYSQWYVDKVRAAAKSDPCIRFTGGIYDQQLLDQLYANAATYIHGHSVGGTNPSLLRAMGAGAPVLAYDVEFNREVTANTAIFWRDADALIAIFNQIANHDLDAKLAELPAIEKQRIRDAYQWDAVTDEYEKLANKMLADKGEKPKAKKGKGTSSTKASS
jgi:glycosyltransferase involved in cell wall biosynthesis